VGFQSLVSLATVGFRALGFSAVGFVAVGFVAVGVTVGHSLWVPVCKCPCVAPWQHGRRAAALSGLQLHLSWCIQLALTEGYGLREALTAPRLKSRDYEEVASCTGVPPKPSTSTVRPSPGRTRKRQRDAQSDAAAAPLPTRAEILASTDRMGAVLYLLCAAQKGAVHIGGKSPLSLIEALPPLVLVANAGLQRLSRYCWQGKGPYKTLYNDWLHDNIRALFDAVFTYVPPSSTHASALVRPQTLLVSYKVPRRLGSCVVPQETRPDHSRRGLRSAAHRFAGVAGVDRTGGDVPRHPRP